MFTFKPKKSLMILLALLLLILPACEVEKLRPSTEAVTQTAEAQGTQAAATETAAAAAKETAQAAATETAAVAATQTAVAATQTAGPRVSEDLTPDLVETLQKQGSFSILIKILLGSNLREEFENQEYFTLFAPTDDAFNKLPPETLQSLLDSPQLLRETLFYHVLEEPMTTNHLKMQTNEIHEGGTPIARLRTIQGDSVTIADLENGLKVNNANIILPDIEMPNGNMIHGIDIVLQSVAFAELPPPDDLIEPIEVWEPYEEGERLPIGDAELVPGAPEMREGIRKLAELLRENQIQINTARTIRLEAHGQTNYLAPVGQEFVPQNADEIQLQPDQNGLTMGVLVIEEENQAFAHRTQIVEISQFGQGLVELVDPTGKVVNGVGFSVDPQNIKIEQSEIPYAAMFYGSHLCRYGWNSFTVCFYCIPGSSAEQCSD